MLYNLNGYEVHLFIRELGNKFVKDDIEVIAESKERYISFKVKINVKLTEVSNKDGKGARKNIHFGFIYSSIIMTSGLDKLASKFLGLLGAKGYVHTSI